MPTRKCDKRLTRWKKIQNYFHQTKKQDICICNFLVLNEGRLCTKEILGSVYSLQEHFLQIMCSMNGRIANFVR